MQELSIKGNELGDEGVKAICSALKERGGGVLLLSQTACALADFSALDFGNNKRQR